jgi:predicted DNA-binding protein
MSVALSDSHPLPIDVQENLVRLSGSVGLPPAEVIRQALDLFAQEWEDRQAAERITPRAAELRDVIARKPRPSTWHDSDEPLF